MVFEEPETKFITNSEAENFKTVKRMKALKVAYEKSLTSKK